MKADLFIIPLDLGTLSSIDKSVFTHLRNQGEKIDVPCLAWVILGGEKNVLVDTGPCDPDWAARYHRPLNKEPSQEVVHALKGHNLRPEDIDVVIFTHLHWDHCFNLEHFSTATFFVQRTELQYAVAPLSSDSTSFEVGLSGVKPPWMEVFGNITAVDGDEEIMPGIKTVLVPGHTPGSQAVEVTTRDGLWLIAGDTVPLFENWKGDEREVHIPGGVYQNLYDFYASLKKLEYCEERILPGHEANVLKHARYPY